MAFNRENNMKIIWWKRLTVVWAMVLSTPAMAQNAVARPENLVVEGVPTIPNELAEAVDRYTNFRSAPLASWHPIRREMLIETRFAETLQVHRVKEPGGSREQLTFFKDNVENVWIQPTHGNYFVFGKDIGGDENYQRYRFDFDSGAITLLTDGKSRNTDGVWSNAGDLFTYGSTRRHGKDVDLWAMNPADPKSNRMLVQLEGGGWTPIAFSPDDRKLLIGEYISANEKYLWLVDMKSGSKSPFLTKTGNEKIVYSHAEFSRDGNGIYAMTDKDSEFLRLAYIDLATKTHTFLTDDIKWDVEDFSLSWDGKTIAFVVNEDGRGVLHLLETATGKERPVPQLPVGLVGGVRWHKNNRDLGFWLISVHSTLDTYSLDIETGNVERWTFSESGGLNMEKFAEAELIKWRSFDGRMISAWEYKAPAQFSGKRPVIIEIHGGPEGQSRPAPLGAWNYLVDEFGVTILHPNVRGSTGYGKTFVTLDDGLLREDSYKDIGTLLDWIEQQPDLDAQRVMVTGGSYGGFMTLAAATQYADRIRCAVDVVGPSNLVTFLKNTSEYRQDLRRAEYGDERDPKVLEFLNRIAPLNHVEKITKPLFVIQGENDPRVPLSESVQMVQAVRAHGTPVWYLMAKDEGHGFTKKKNRDYQMMATVFFVKKYLLN
jgi:dipeptidyl aminopeptidase/acylaminoacyl peptidase